MKKDLKILVATDYSDTAANVSKYAIQFAADTGAELFFLHVFDSSHKYPIEFSTLEKFDNVPVEFEMRELIQYTKNIVSSLGSNFKKIKINHIVREEHIGKTICEEALYVNSDIIFIGTHGETALHQVFFGSHTWDVINQAKLPVLAIPKEAVYNGVHHFMLATEYRIGELPILQLLLKWVKFFKADLKLFHVTNDVFSEGFEIELLNKFENDIQKNLPNETVTIQLIYNNDLVDGINLCCDKSKSNWLVMCPEKSHLLEKVFGSLSSTTKEMSFHTHVPLLTIPDYDSPSNLKFWDKMKKEFAL
ncbi:MAG: universal stress protein [Bacteroidia bacterium]